MTSVLITGATGHAGSHLVERILRTTDWEIVSLQRDPTKGVAHPRVRKVLSNFRAPLNARTLREIGSVRYIIHNGARVPNAGTVNAEPEQFLQDNTVGTFNMLEAARSLGVERFLYTSTGQVLGSSPLRQREHSRMNPPHVYAASKAAGELLVHGYFKSFRLPTITTRVMNLFGERQQATKFIPGTLARALRGEPTSIPVDISGQPQRVQWLHADHYAVMLLFLLEKEQPGGTYHISGEYRSTEGVARLIEQFAGIPVPLRFCSRNYVEEYHIDVAGANINTTEHPPKMLPFACMLERTVGWYMRNQEFLR